MEVENLRGAKAYGKSCIGCQTYGSDIMVSLHNKENGELQFFDFFLTTPMAESLLKDLQKQLELNKEGNDE